MNNDPQILDLQTIDEAPQRTDSLPVVADNHSATLMLAMVQKGATPEQLEKMMDLLERQDKRDLERERREAEKAFNAAFADFRGEELTVLKDKDRTNGPLQGQKYATLFAFVRATKEALSKHGLSVSWSVTRDEPLWIEVTCILKHKLGHSQTVAMGGPPDTGPARNVLQARHSTVSYLERYTLKAICGLAEQDDDDDGAGGKRRDDGAPDPVLAAGRDRAMAGSAALHAWWDAIGKEERKRLAKELPGLRRAAGEADHARS